MRAGFAWPRGHANFIRNGVPLPCRCSVRDQRQRHHGAGTHERRRRRAVPGDAMDVDSPGAAICCGATAPGARLLWLMKAMQVTSTPALSALPAWRVVQAGRFDGDGKSELVWRNATTAGTRSG